MYNVSFSSDRRCVNNLITQNDCYYILFFSPVMQYTERDQDGSYTMLSGDIVRFKIATDKRDGSRRATGVVLHKLVESQEGHVTREKVGFDIQTQGIEPVVSVLHVYVITISIVNEINGMGRDGMG